MATQQQQQLQHDDDEDDDTGGWAYVPAKDTATKESDAVLARKQSLAAEETLPVRRTPVKVVTSVVPGMTGREWQKAAGTGTGTGSGSTTRCGGDEFQFVPAARVPGLGRRAATQLAMEGREEECGQLVTI